MLGWAETNFVEFFLSHAVLKSNGRYELPNDSDHN